MFTIRYPEDLPVSLRRGEILNAIRAHQVLIIAGETGSGKTTQIPKMLLEAGVSEHGKIGCTQPRRVAAMSVSKRVAEELQVPWGREVGCKMRFNDDTGRDTKIKFMTDGILLAEIQSDPMLRQYSALMLDEAHERSLNIDFLLGYLRGLLKRRPDLKLVVASATLDTQSFSEAFGGAPIIEVSGRMFPVEVRYSPAITDSEEIHYVDAAVSAVEDALIESDFGDVLVFMPTERDIRETREILEGSLGTGVEVIGLFGRMPAAEQQRIFAPGAKRRVIVATNIAETSLTLPRIRFVIDAGLSRISRYNPRTRTKRLPVEPISQSSANQRAGRAGRVAEGICVRLYSQEDYDSREPFTQPEIQRANLAEVILRMKAFRLGDIETFPFINPPAAASIRAGYTLLHELGAIDEVNELTPLGRELASLPVDPTLGRMLLQARSEGVLAEMLVIAAGLSVPDPRERPEDQKEAAAAAHKTFADNDSDFLSLLHIWNDAPEAEGRGGGNALRRFCKAHFLSLSRMREWRDIHWQLADAVQSARDEKKPPQTHEEHYAAIHRAVLSGLLGQIAQRTEKNNYKAAGNRMATLFPGSNLYERREKQAKSRKPSTPDEKVRQPEWIVAGEIVETSQLFARTVAGVMPEWIEHIGSHLCSLRHSDPHWSSKAGRVLCVERVLIHGLEIGRRMIDYGRINSEEATELFIRGALIEEGAHVSHRFFTENAKLREKLENALTRVRSRRAHDLEESLFLFYADRIRGVSSIHDLAKLVRERSSKQPDFLIATEDDLVGDHDTSFDKSLFPDKVELGNTVLPVMYAFSPGEENDGVTVRVPLPAAAQLTSAQIQWMVPGLREEQIGVLLRALPKSARKQLMPIEPKIAEVAATFQPGRGDFLAELAGFLSRKYRVEIRATDWPPNSLPSHLKPRIEVVDHKNKALASGRELAAVQSAVDGHDLQTNAWSIAAKKWEQRGLTVWSFGDLPESVVVEQIAGSPLLAFPGLDAEEKSVAVRLFRKKEDAAKASVRGVRRLAELVLATDLARLKKELAGFAKHIPASQKQTASFHDALQAMSAKLNAPQAAFITPEILQNTAFTNLLDHTLALSPALPLTQTRFQTLVENARSTLPRLTWQLGDWTRQLLALRQAILASPKRYIAMEYDVQRILPPNFLARTPYQQVPHLMRYLKAVQIRAERAVVNPAKDQEKSRQLTPFGDWETRVPADKKEAFRWLLEEFRVSLFAQELGTAQPASAQRLRELGGY
jgi:ATP-dependent helicase HrpA